jgi:hypothetical protein
MMSQDHDTRSWNPERTSAPDFNRAARGEAEMPKNLKPSLEYKPPVPVPALGRTHHVRAHAVDRKELTVTSNEQSVTAHPQSQLSPKEQLKLKLAFQKAHDNEKGRETGRGR